MSVSIGRSPAARQTHVLREVQVLPLDRSTRPRVVDFPEVLISVSIEAVMSVGHFQQVQHFTYQLLPSSLRAKQPEPSLETLVFHYRTSRMLFGMQSRLMLDLRGIQASLAS